MTFWCERGSNNGAAEDGDPARHGRGDLPRQPSGGTGAVDYGAIRFDADA